MVVLYKGLENVVASNSSICFIDGDKGILSYRGLDIHDLAQQSTFEEVCTLLWKGKLPTGQELAEVKRELGENRALPDGVISWLCSAPKTANPMDILRTAVSAISHYDPEVSDNSAATNYRKAVRLTATVAPIVAAWDRLRRGRNVLEPDPSLGQAADFLRMLTGEPPNPLAERAMDIALILHADHEFNASTFAARVTVSTLSDLYAGAVAALGTLKGPLHGGANQEVMKMLDQVRRPEEAETYVDKALSEHQKIPGFGHRVYHTEDPRATHLRKMSEQLCQNAGKGKLFETSRKIEQAMKQKRALNANVDFYSGTVYHCLGISTDLFTSIFAVSRMSGWTAHMMEQLADNRLIRPRAEYVGPTYPQKYAPLSQRSA